MVRRTVCLVAAIVGFLLFELGMADEAGIPLPEGAVARLELGDNVFQVKFSPDGRYLAVGTSLGIELRDADTLELVRFFRGHTDSVYSCLLYTSPSPRDRG